MPIRTWLQARETRAHVADFEDRGLENVKGMVLYANFAPDKDRAARRWIRRQETFYLRVSLYVAIAGLIVGIATLYFKSS